MTEAFGGAVFKAEKISALDVIGATFQTFFSDFWRFCGITLLGNIPSILFTLAMPAFMPTFSTQSPPAGPTANQLTLIYATDFVLAVGASFAFAATSYAAVQRLQGHKFGFGDAVGAGIARMFPTFAVFVCVVIASSLASVLLVFPGFMVWTMWCVATVVTIVERPGFAASFSRSSFLTRDNRWRIFWAFVLSAIMTWGFYAVISFISLMFIGMPPLGAGADIHQLQQFQADVMSRVRYLTLAILPFTTILTTFLYILPSAIYYKLRAAKETPMNVAHIFE